MTSDNKFRFAVDVELPPDSSGNEIINAINSFEMALQESYDIENVKVRGVKELDND